MNLHFQPTKDNPYAWDFYGKQNPLSSVPYDELEDISTFLRVSYAFEIIFGGILSLFMLYLVIYKSTGYLKPYSKMLFLCTITDISYWATDNFIQVKAKLTDGVFMIKMESWARCLPYHGQIVAMCMYVVCLSLIHSILPAQYYFRYYTVTRSRSLSTLRTFGLYMVSLGLAIPMGMIAYPAYSISALERPGFNYGTLWYREVPLPPVLYADVRSIYHKCYFFYASLVVIGGYGVAMIYAYKTLVYLQVHSKSYSVRTKAMQAQLSKALLFQTILPLFVSVGPIVSICVPSFFYTDTGKTAMLFMQMASWVPTFNPLLTIIAIVPYRKVVTKWIPNKTTVQSVSQRETPHVKDLTARNLIKVVVIR